MSQPTCRRLGASAAARNAIDLARGEQYVAASGVQAERAELADSELVFVGYGIEAPEYQWDDFKGVDVSGKVLVMLNNDPDWDPALFAGTERLYYGRWVYKHESAERQGAAGVIIIHTTPSAGYPWQVVQSSWSGPQFELPATGREQSAGESVGHGRRRAAFARARAESRVADRAGETPRLHARAARHPHVARVRAIL